MPDKPQVQAYGSAGDLPSVVEMRKQLAGLKLLKFVLPKEDRAKIRELDLSIQRMVTQVDRFYDLLGQRSWVYNDRLDMSAMDHVLEPGDPAVAEERFIDLIRTDDWLESSLLRLRRFEAMRPRIELLEKAAVDYREERYYSTVLVLLTVLDGFVNDVELDPRRGLHAREPTEMVAWDSVVGHHLGLGHAHKSFTKTFRKTTTSEVTELFRHGILHGNVTSYDNVVVATKAWNRLFAVADWADAKNAHLAPQPEEPTWKETFGRLNRQSENRRKIDAWSAHETVPGTPRWTASEVVDACEDFLENWRQRRWALVGAHFFQFGKVAPSAGRLAKEAKALYSELPLETWSTKQVRHTASAVAHVDVQLIVGTTRYDTELRWVRSDGAGSSASEWEEGTWKLVPYGPGVFLR